jgi:hypothetical protein
VKRQVTMRAPATRAIASWAAKTAPCTASNASQVHAVSNVSTLIAIRVSACRRCWHAQE